MLLIITNKTDLASDYLILRLEELGIPFFRLNTEDYLSKFQINIFLSNDESKAEIISFNGQNIDVEDIKGVYFRQPIRPKLKANVKESHLAFAERECLEMLRSLWRFIDESLWLNHPKYLLLANNKVDQLIRAINIGFKIPPTTITTDPKLIENFFYLLRGGMIGKALKHGFYKLEDHVKVAPTQKIDNDFIENITSYAEVPMVFQENIKKKYDIRVTVVGNNVYSTAIHSQNFKETEIDWRLWDINKNIDLEHARFELPRKIVQACLDITRSFHLNYSAIDLIYTEDEDFYFLEMNPNGQWAWIEKKVGYPIRDSIIGWLGFKNE